MFLQNIVNICIITPFFNEYPNAMASAEKMAKTFAQHHTVTVLTSRTYNAAAFEKTDGATITRLPAWYIPEPANYVFTRGLLRAIWKQRKTTDIFIINKYMWPVSWSIIFLKLLHKPVIVCVDAFQGYDWWSWSKFVNIIMWTYARTIGWVVLKLADRVILFHEGLEVRAKQLRLQYQVIHNGINPETFVNAKPAVDIQKDPNEVIVTYIGRLDKIKGYLDFLVVAKIISTNANNVKFLVVGNTHNRDEVLKKYQSDKIVFTGVRKDIPSILASSDILVLPTYGDGLPNVIMEAMAAGLPTISTNVNGIPYLIDDGETGIVIAPRDAAALEAAITTLIASSELRISYGKAAQKKVFKEFNWDKIIEQYSVLFTELTRPN